MLSNVSLKKLKFKGFFCRSNYNYGKGFSIGDYQPCLKKVGLAEVTNIYLQVNEFMMNYFNPQKQIYFYFQP